MRTRFTIAGRLRYKTCSSEIWVVNPSVSATNTYMMTGMNTGATEPKLDSDTTIRLNLRWLSTIPCRATSIQLDILRWLATN